MKMNVNMIMLILPLPLMFLVYSIIPKIYLYIKSDEYRKSLEEKNERAFKLLIEKFPMPHKMKYYISDKLSKSGLDNISDMGRMLIIFFLFPVVSGIYFISLKDSHVIAFVLIISSILLPVFQIKKNIEKREKAFAVNAYKIYSFLNSQISSGIKSTDAVRGMYEVVDDAAIRNVFIKFAAHYEFTLDINKSLDIIRRSFSGYDSEMLCVSIDQCIKTGMAGKTLRKMEKIMFEKYFTYLKKNSDDYRTKLLISAVFAIVPLLLIFTLPVLFDAFKGLEGILNYS